VVRTLSFLLLFFVSLNAQSLNSAISDIMDQREYSQKKKFIDILFKNRDSFFIGSRVDYKKIIAKLRDEGLDKLAKKSSNLKVSFITRDDNLQIFIKIVSDTLASLGFTEIETIKLKRDERVSIWVISLGDNYMLDPLLFIDRLEKKRVFVDKIKRYTATNWSYILDISDVNLVPKVLPFNTDIKLKKTLSSYWINIKESNKINISSSRSNRWHPYVIMYNKDLKILSKITKSRVQTKLRLNIPSDGAYLKIDDYYTIKNIKDGLTINIQKRE
jgi:hypothetical protein